VEAQYPAVHIGRNDLLYDLYSMYFLIQGEKADDKNF